MRPGGHVVIKYILDTSVVGAYFRGIEPVFSRVNSLPKDEVAITAVTIAEFYKGFYRADGGARKKPSQDELNMMKNALHSYKMLPLDAIVAHEFGRLKAKFAPDN